MKDILSGCKEISKLQNSSCYWRQMMKIKKLIVILAGLLLMLTLAAGASFANEQWNYDHEEYLDVIDLFWSVD